MAKVDLGLVVSLSTVTGEITSATTTIGKLPKANYTCVVLFPQNVSQYSMRARVDTNGNVIVTTRAPYTGKVVVGCFVTA